MIREIKAFEVGLCLEAGQVFFDESKVPGGFDNATFCKNWGNLINSGTGTILVAFEGTTQIGALGAVLCPDMFNGDLVAVEAFWYMIKKYRGQGLRLLSAFEAWAKDRSAKRVAMIHLESLQPEVLRRVYERFGYKLIESHYVKTI